MQQRTTMDANNPPKESYTTKETTKALLTVAQYYMMYTCVNSLRDGDFATATAAFLIAAYLEKLSVWLFNNVLNDKPRAKYISDNYSEISQLPNFLKSTAIVCANKIKPHCDKISINFMTPSKKM